MLALITLQLVLAQAPELRTPVAVVITSKRPGAEAVSPKIAQRVFDSFKREGVTGLLDDAASAKELKAAGFSDPKSCQGGKDCLSKLAVLLGPRAVVVGVDVGKVGKSLAIHLEAVAADQEGSVATLDVASAVNGWSDAMSAPIVTFVRDVKAGLEVKKKLIEPPPPPPVADDAPKKNDLTPRAKDDVPAVVAAQQKGPKVGAIVVTASAVAAAGAAVAFAVVSSSAKTQFDASLVDLGNGQMGSRLPEAQARELASTANTGAGVAIGAGVVAAGLAVVSTILFLKD